MENIQLADIARALRSGATIIYPTETCYGLGCDARDEAAVQRIFAIKQRIEKKPLLVVVPDVAMIMDYVVWTPTLERLASKYWPGALTVVTSLRPDVHLPRGVVSDDNTLAFRVTSHPFAAELSRALGAPLVSTSANLAGKANIYNIDEALAVFSQANVFARPDIVIDAGELPERAPSTIVRVDGEHITVLRQGGIILNQVL